MKTCMPRNKKQEEKRKRSILKKKKLEQEIREYGADILQSPNFNLTKFHIQHGNVTVNDHCRTVARYSLAISKKLEKIGIHCKNRELVRGALLHDYFLYDWHSNEHVNPLRLHGFFHPGIALANAKKEYKLTKREEEIIKKHMWPLTVVPPTCKEAWVVTTADKWCSILETLKIRKGHGIETAGTES